MHSYLLFHSLAEITAATISFGTFMFAWNTRRFQNAYLLTVGAAALFVGTFEVLHCLAFPGMQVFVGFDTNLSPQLWLSARIIQASASLVGLLLLERRVRAWRLLAGFALAFAVICLAVFTHRVPAAVQHPSGLTPFKLGVEWTLVVAFLLSVALLYRARDRFSPRVFGLLVAHGVTMAACEICFMLYAEPYDLSNLLGHLLLLGGGGLEYLAILRAGLIDPSKTHFRDLTQIGERLERAREQAERRAAELDAILDSLAEPLVVSDAKGQIVRINPAFQRLFGPVEPWQAVELGERLERVKLETVDGKPLNPEQTPGARALTGETVHGVLQRWHLEDGTVLHLATSSAPIRTAAGIVGAVVIFTDVTEQVRAEQALREMDQRKNEFMAVLSHELRNPLAPIRNSLHILGRVAPGSEQAVRGLAVIQRQVDQLSRLVDDLLDLTRISRNKIQLQRERLELNELVRRTVEDHRSIFEEERVHIHVHPADSAVFVHADGSRLAQVIGNLLQNAVKFTPPGGRVDVSVTLSGAPKRVEIRIADTGVGLNSEVLPRLFQPFVQADETLDRSKGGLGLGLALVKGLIELHGGDVGVQSEGLGKGAVFVVSLPKDDVAVEQPVPLPKVTPRRAAARVLIIEDNVDAAETLGEVLRFEGHDVAVAYNGREGIERARELRPDVILCDIGLPGMDGYEVARALRANATLARTRLVALSGYALPDDLRRASEAGFDRHLAKPPSLEKLAMVLEEGNASAGRIA